MGISLYARMQARKDLEDSSCKIIARSIMSHEKLKEHEQNYPTLGIKLVTNIHALKM